MITSSTVTRLIRAQQAVKATASSSVDRSPPPASATSTRSCCSTTWGPWSSSPARASAHPGTPTGGFETVTYLLEGDAEHRDSMGNHGFMSAGDTQWMTAGSGVLHKEGPSASSQAAGGRMHGLQLWVNLPADKKMIDPAYQDLRAEANAVRHDAGATVRVIAGELFGLQGPGSTHTPIAYGHVTLVAGATVTTALPQGHRVLVYPMVGAIAIGDTQIDEGILAVVEGAELELRGVSDQSEVIVLTGEPIGEPVARYGPFVMNTEQEIRQAFTDFERGLFGSPQD